MEKNKKNINDITLPVLLTLGEVAYPKGVVSIDISRAINVDAVDMAIKHKLDIFVICQKNNSIEYPAKKDLYDVGTVVSIRQFQKRAHDVFNFTGVGLYRASIKEYFQQGGHAQASIKRIPEKRKSKATKEEMEVITRALKKAFIKYAFAVKLNAHQDIAFLIEKENNVVGLFNMIVAFVPMESKVKQNLLEQDDIYYRLVRLLEQINREITFAEMENKLIRQIEDKIDKNQRDYYLREKAKLINEELSGEKEEPENNSYRLRINKIKNMDKTSKEKLLKEVDKMESMPDLSHESYIISNYLDTVLNLPWDNGTSDKMDLNRAQKQLDADHYGLSKVKDRIIENLAVRVFKKDIKGQIICLVGPPGVGKTSLGKSIADAMGRKFLRISLGGVNDESEIRGHRKTYIGAMPGRIVGGLIQAKSKNPLILLDEIDKMTSNFRGDPASAMLEVLDSEQNSLFVDHYIEIPFDLSDCLFITTANSIGAIPSPLLDRMEVIEISSYTANEKFHIAKEHLINKQLKTYGLTRKQIKIKDETIRLIINGYTREAGVRSLERLIATLIRKGAKKIALSELKSVTFTNNNLEKYLGPKKYLEDQLEKKDEIGVVNGLAWTSVGGERMQIEVVAMKGKGEVKLTGNLGDVMKESAHAAISFVRSVAHVYGIPDDFYRNTDIHIHLPEGAIPKDGPSAGITLTIAIISALSKRPVKSNIAMTGEVTLRGRVLPIGGLKEKSIAAYKSGIKSVYIPQENLRDLSEIDEEVKSAIEFIPVKNAQEVLDGVLLKQQEDIVENSKTKVKYKKRTYQLQTQGHI